MRVLTWFACLTLCALVWPFEARPATVDDLVNKAADAALKGDLKQSIKLLDDALRIDPRHAIAYVTRGTAYRRMGDFARAIEDCTKAIDIDPKMASAYCQRGSAYQQSKLENRVEQAFVNANKAIELDATNPLSFIVRGVARMDRKEYREAIGDLSKAIELNPASYSAYANRGRVYFVLGRTEKALDDVNRALSYNPSPDERRGLVELRKFIQTNP
jgi:tetratricopeptide (TPR) repeat protein